MKMKVAPLAGILLLAAGFAADAYGPGPYPYPDFRGYGSAPYPPNRSQRPIPQHGVRMERGADQQAYYVTLYLNGMSPEDLAIRATERELFIQSVGAVSTQEVDKDRGFRSFELRSSAFNRHLRLPPDADVDTMSREDEEGVIRLVIPRRQYP